MSSHGTVERRRHERRVSRTVVEVWACAGLGTSDPVAGVMVDVSVSGVGLIVRGSFEAGDEILVPIEKTDGGVGSAGLYVVATCRPAGNDPSGGAVHRVGARLVCVLRGEALERKAPGLATHARSTADPKAAPAGDGG